MSDDKSTPNILDDIFRDVADNDAPIEIPAFQPVASAPRPRAPRPKPQSASIAETVPTSPIPVIIKPVEWEYREVVFRDYRGWRVRFVDGREPRDWKNGPTLREYLESAGKEGWELVSISDPHHSQKAAYLKRIKN